jgi:hypothetical protein
LKYIQNNLFSVVTPERMKSRVDLENSDDLKMPPPLTVPVTKTPAIFEPVEPPAPEPPKFEIFQDEPDPPVAKPRPTHQYFNPNDSCSTQTFNFFIKSQSVSTPKANKVQRSVMTIVEDLPMQPIKSSIYSPPEQSHDNPEEYQTPPLTVNTLANKQLSTIMETTETNTMSSAVTTKSSVDQVSEVVIKQTNCRVLVHFDRIYFGQKNVKKVEDGRLTEMLFG